MTHPVDFPQEFPRSELKLPTPRAWLMEKPDPTGGTMRWVAWTRERADNHIGLYTADQMREYGELCARMAREQERERCAKLADSMDCAMRCRVGGEVAAAIRKE